MTDDMIALARRAVACKGWRWLPGMLAVNEKTRSEARVLYDGTDLYVLYAEGYSYLGGSVPVLTDPATVGCLLALVREAWGPDLRIFRDGVWFVEYVPPHAPENMYGQRTFTGATEAEALVDALVNAP